jgi:hypothetical protein
MITNFIVPNMLEVVNVIFVIHLLPFLFRCFMLLSRWAVGCFVLGRLGLCCCSVFCTSFWYSGTIAEPILLLVRPNIGTAAY